MTFADEAVVFVRAGKGGDGSASLRREPYTPQGGPDGGDGGDGGSVVLRVSTGVRDLAFLVDHPHQRAASGGPGSRARRSGRAGDDLVLDVPDGTVVRDERGPVADLVGEGARVVVARGGRGGRGNATLAGPRNKAPKSEPGEVGEEHRLELELRMVADIGLVGLPNAGKSTLLSKLTAARPKIADYPFTTLTPNLGVVDADRRIVLADVPGLIEGAHQGRGLGLGFLRHVSRCRALVVVVDLSSEDPVEDLRTVRAELDSYDVALGGRALLVAASKIDLLEDSSDVLARLSAEAETVAVSGLTGEGVGTLQARLDALAQEATEEEEREPYVVLRPARERFVVTRHGGGFHVSGRDVERWVEATDLDDPAAVATLQRRLTREGVERKLSALGARRGDEVVIAGKAFEFLPEEDGWTGDRS